MSKIILNKREKRLLRLCKGRHPFKNDGTIIGLLEKYYKKHYALDPKKYLYEFRSCMFTNLFELYMKIRENTGYYNDILTIFNDSFYKGIVRTSETPIERAIESLFGYIQSTTVRTRKNNTSKYTWRFDIY